MKWHEAEGIEEVRRHRLGSGARGMDAGARVEDGGGGVERAVSDDREGGDVVWEGAAVEILHKKLYGWFRRSGYRKRAPQSMAEKTDAQAQKAWKRAMGSLVVGGAKARGRGGVCR